MGLHIGEGAIEQPLGAVDGELLDHIDILTAAVIALARIAFGIFVGEQSAGSVEHGLGNDILRGDQLDLVLLPMLFLLDRAPDLWVGVLKMPGEETGIARLGTPCVTCRHRQSLLANCHAGPALPVDVGQASFSAGPRLRDNSLPLPHVARVR